MCLMSSKVTTHISKAIDRNKIVCSLSVGEHLKRIQGLDYFKNAYDYEVNGEYPYLYLIRIKYRTGSTLASGNYTYTTVSKASIYCGHVVLIKEDGRRVEAYQKGDSC